MRFVQNNNLKAVFPFLDNITICGKDQADHDTNLDLLLEAARKTNLKFNESKSVFSTRRLPLLQLGVFHYYNSAGYVIEEEM